jgi:thiamine kinase-like enzyme
MGFWRVRMLLDNSLFQTNAILSWPEEILLDKMCALQQEIKQNWAIEIYDYELLQHGQGKNFKVTARWQNKTTQLKLKIITIPGYPDLDTLKKCYELLDGKNLPHPKIVAAIKESSVFPYGYILQQWIEGQPLSAHPKVNDPDFLAEKIIAALKPIHNITLSYFYGLVKPPFFSRLSDYFYNIEKAIIDSFAKVPKYPITLKCLEKYNIVDKHFVDLILRKIKKVAVLFPDNITASLLHGDPLPSNLLLSNDKTTMFIDWDETRGGWWGYDIARITYYSTIPDLLKNLISGYADKTLTNELIELGISLEHIRQDLRQLFILGFQPRQDKQYVIEQARLHQQRILDKIEFYSL